MSQNAASDAGDGGPPEQVLDPPPPLAPVVLVPKRPEPDGVNYTSSIGTTKRSRLYRFLDHGHPLAFVTFSFDNYRRGPAGKEPSYYLKCTYRKKDHRCDGRAVIHRGQMKACNKTAHTCLMFESKETRERKVLLNLARGKMASRAEREGTSIKKIYNEVLRDEPRCVKEDLTFVRAQRTMGRARTKTRPPTPDSLEKLVEKFDAGAYADQYQALYRGSVTVTIKGKKHYALIFGIEENFRKACTKAVDFCIDGTFGVIPGYIQFLNVRASQVLNLVGDYCGALVGLFTVVMTCRKVSLYRAVYGFIKNAYPYFSPRTIMSDWEVALRKAAAVTWNQARILGCWFHFAKALFAKMKGKFRLACFFLVKASAVYRKIAQILKQYLVLPLLRPEHIGGAVKALEVELKKESATLQDNERRRLNRFHNYVITYWCQLVGPANISVFNAPYTTNNRLERFNKDLNDFCGRHPQFFKFLDMLSVHVYSAAEAVMLQVDAGTFEIKDCMSVGEKVLVEAGRETLEAYRAMRLQPKSVLESAAAHFNNKELLRELHKEKEVAPANPSEIFTQDELEPPDDLENQASQNEVNVNEDEGADVHAGENDLENQASQNEVNVNEDEGDNELPDIDVADVMEASLQEPESASAEHTAPQDVLRNDPSEIDERVLVLERDPDLEAYQDTTDDWITVDWMDYTALEARENLRIEAGDNLNEKVVITCPVCAGAMTYAVNMKCQHGMCLACNFHRLMKRCPFCRKRKTYGCLSNVGFYPLDFRANQMVLRREEQAAAAEAVSDDSSSSDDEHADEIRRNEEMIYEVLRGDGVEDPVAYRRQLERQDDLGALAIQVRAPAGATVRESHRNFPTRNDRPQSPTPGTSQGVAPASQNEEPPLLDSQGPSGSQSRRGRGRGRGRGTRGSRGSRGARGARGNGGRVASSSQNDLIDGDSSDEDLPLAPPSSQVRAGMSSRQAAAAQRMAERRERHGILSDFETDDD